jgi:hypothetical protein
MELSNGNFWPPHAMAPNEMRCSFLNCLMTKVLIIGSWSFQYNVGHATVMVASAGAMVATRLGTRDGLR